MALEAFKLDGALVHGLMKKKKVNFKNKFKNRAYTSKDCKTFNGFSIEEMFDMLGRIAKLAQCSDDCPYMQPPSLIPHVCTQRVTDKKIEIIRPDRTVQHHTRVLKYKHTKKHVADGRELFYHKFNPKFVKTPLIPQSIHDQLPLHGNFKMGEYIELRNLMESMFKERYSRKRYCEILSAIKHWNKNVDNKKYFKRDLQMYAVYNNINEKYLKVPCT